MAKEIIRTVTSWIRKLIQSVVPSEEERLRRICEYEGSVNDLVKLQLGNPSLFTPSSSLEGEVFSFSKNVKRCGYTPLTLASYSGNLEVVRHLIQNQLSDANERDKKWAATALHHAARNNKVAVARYLLEVGGNVNAVTKNKSHISMPLHWAASNGCIDVAKVLIANGAEINGQDMVTINYTSNMAIIMIYEANDREMLSQYIINRIKLLRCIGLVIMDNLHSLVG